MNIRIKYDEIEENGKKLVKLCEEYQEIYEVIQKVINDFNNSWNSSNKELYQQKLEILINNIDKNRKYFEIMGNLMVMVKEKFLLTEHNICNLMQNEVIKSEDIYNEIQ